MTEPCRLKNGSPWALVMLVIKEEEYLRMRDCHSYYVRDNIGLSVLVRMVSVSNNLHNDFRSSYPRGRGIVLFL